MTNSEFGLNYIRSLIKRSNHTKGFCLKFIFKDLQSQDDCLFDIRALCESVIVTRHKNPAEILTIFTGWQIFTLVESAWS
jgi:hypothetical protein